MKAYISCQSHNVFDFLNKKERISMRHLYYMNTYSICSKISNTTKIKNPRNSLNNIISWSYTHSSIY